MARTTHIITAFNGGEASPLLHGRIDLAKYTSLARQCRNFLPLVQGAIRRRPGTAFVRPAKGRCTLVPFQFSVDQAYVLEVGHNYLRIHLNHGTLLVPPAGPAPFELATPWTEAALFSTDGTCRLRFVQSNDVMWLACPGVPPQKLQRLGATEWTLVPLITKHGPFRDLNDDKTLTIHASAATGAVTLTASSSVFRPGHAGSLIHMEMRDTRGVRPWEPNQVIAVGDLCLSGNCIYRCSAVQAGTSQPATGTVKPLHTFGRAWDGGDTWGDSGQLQGIEWEFVSPRYGFVRITAVTSGTVASGTVVGDWPLPEHVVGAANATWRWALAAYSEAEGWPEHVAFFRNRLVLCRGARVDFSVVGDFENFAARDYGDLTADMAVAVQLQSDRTNVTQWLAPANGLLLGTTGGEFLISEQTTAEPFGPSNVKAVPHTAWGSRGIVPPRVGGMHLFAARGGRKLRAAQYDAGADSYRAPDQTWISEHLLGAGLIALAYQAQPDSIVWAVTSAGDLLSYTIDPDQEAYAWAPQPIADGQVEAIAVIPAPDGDGDELWLAVRRTVGGGTVRHIEYLTRPFRRGDARDSVWHVDAGLRRTGAPVTGVSGLSHLEGKAVQVVADGRSHPDRVVAGGAITLAWPAATVLVGLRAPATFEPMTLEAGSRAGTAQGKTQRIHEVKLRLLDTGGGKIGPADALDGAGQLDDLLPAAEGGTTPPLFSGDIGLRIDSDYTNGARFILHCDDAQPCTLVAAMVGIATYD